MARQYLSNGLIVAQRRPVAAHEGEEIGRETTLWKSVECAERGVDSPVFAPDFHCRGLGSGDPAVPDSGLSSTGTRRCRDGAVAGLAGTVAAGVADHLRDALRLPVVGRVRYPDRHADC